MRLASLIITFIITMILFGCKNSEININSFKSVGSIDSSIDHTWKLDMAGGANKVIVAGNYAYVLTGENRLNIVDISTPSAPKSVGSCEFVNSLRPGGAVTPNDIVIIGQYAFVLVTNGVTTISLESIDISDPTAPTKVGSFEKIHENGTGFGDLAVSKDHVYIAALNVGVHSINVSDPTTPVLADTFDTDGDAYDITISGNTAYVADGTNGLVLLDITNPTSMSLLNRIDTGGTAVSVAMQETLVYISNNAPSELTFVNTDDINNLSLAGMTLDTPADAHQVTFKSSGTNILANGVDGLYLGSPGLSSPPRNQGTFDTAGNYVGISISSGYAFIADYDNGLIIVDISDVTDPKQDESSLPSFINSVATVELLAAPGNLGEMKFYGLYEGYNSTLFVTYVTDSDGAPVVNQEVTLNLLVGDGIVPETIVTDSDGKASLYLHIPDTILDSTDYSLSATAGNITSEMLVITYVSPI